MASAGSEKMSSCNTPLNSAALLAIKTGFLGRSSEYWKTVGVAVT